ncbi:hypothetical protein [Gimesia sp.]|uniref:hypothetical protein n=1 Tax=Gimesia sp. TaxID=2024833 RepID=UPI000C510DB5|nr:hypothetical protein [Gimesia sp.]MAX35814.1 hypothetical protein [Gimesia sp.]HAH48880.1 hypothetical protein [Planctomycetaceae bacterium]|tara:strand:- start:42 stop:569 length:528 start_codon:yes stop_codon:yes gene_type:complete
MKTPRFKETIEDAIRRIIFNQSNWSATTKLREYKQPHCEGGDRYDIYDEAGREVEAKIVRIDDKWYNVDEDYTYTEINTDDYITPKIRQEIEVEKLKQQIDHIVKDVSIEDQAKLKDIMHKLSVIDYERGYADGHTDGGVDHGYDNGYDDGRKEGYAAGLYHGKMEIEEEEEATA